MSLDGQKWIITSTIKTTNKTIKNTNKTTKKPLDHQGHPTKTRPPRWRTFGLPVLSSFPWRSAPSPSWTKLSVRLQGTWAVRWRFFWGFAKVLWPFYLKPMFWRSGIGFSTFWSSSKVLMTFHSSFYVYVIIPEYCEGKQKDFSLFGRNRCSKDRISSRPDSFPWHESVLWGSLMNGSFTHLSRDFQTCARCTGSCTQSSGSYCP